VAFACGPPDVVRGWRCSQKSCQDLGRGTDRGCVAPADPLFVDRAPLPTSWRRWRHTVPPDRWFPSTRTAGCWASASRCCWLGAGGRQGQVLPHRL